MIDIKDPKRKQFINNVFQKIEENKIDFILLHFTDISGIQKSLGVNANRLDDIFSSGATFDGSSIDGYGVLQESDMVAIPDPSTFAVIPWKTSDKPVGRFICDIYNPDLSHYDGDPRYILRRAINKAAEMGYEMRAAPELEFFLLKQDPEKLPTTSDMRGYFDSDPAEEDHTIRREIAEYAQKFPFIDVETTHHEVAKSQHEVDIKYGPAMDVSDATQTMKMVVKLVSTRHDYIGTFMPKPFTTSNGSGQHVHQSMWKDGKNLFYDGNDPNHISDIMRWFIGGQLKYAKEMTAIQNSWPNSYKRIVPGYEAPTYIAWGFKNRSMLIRVPNFFNKEKAARCEIRSPDPAGNIYLQIAALLTTGLEGIKNKIDPPAPVELNVYHTTYDERERMGIENLPESFGQALHYYRHSEIMRSMMGESGYKAFLDSKMLENQLYNREVSDWELKRYSARL